MKKVNFNNLPQAVEELLENVELLTFLVNKLLKKVASDKVVDRTIRVKEAAKYLGIKPSTLYIWVSRNQIPYFKVNGSNTLYFSTLALDNYIKSGKRRSIDELSSDADLHIAG